MKGLRGRNSGAESRSDTSRKALLRTEGKPSRKGNVKSTMRVTYSVEVRGSDAVLDFAANELKKYLRKMLPGVAFVGSGREEGHRQGFVLAEAHQASEAILQAQVGAPGDLDQIFILSVGRKLLLSGNNPRSVLFAVYDFLERLGTRWLHPGPGGEFTPQLRRLKLSGWNVMETASFRYRGVCVEGAFTPRHAVAFVDWMAKKKMNHLYMQFENGTFWYRRMVPDLKVSEAREWDGQIVAAVKKRGLMLEWYGHGWNHNAIGKRIVGLDKAYKVPERLRPFLAKVNGKRTWHNNYPLETQLCLTNPAVREKVMRFFKRQVRRSPQADILGFWLADGYNNQCECRRCRKFRMSEMYAHYVNEAAELAHKMRPGLKIEILAYHNTLEPPVRVPIKNPHDNLILILAPLFRCYRHRLHDETCVTDEKIPEFPVLNRQPRLRNGDFVRFFERWRKCYSGDTYLFDYHMLSLRYDFLGGNVPQVASQDIKDLKRHHFDGYVGCQTLRCFWPSGLGMKVISETLWDVTKSYRKIRSEHLQEWFGSAAEEAGQALDAMYRFTRKMLPAHHQMPSHAELHRSKMSLDQIAAMLKEVARACADKVARRRLGFLADHAEFLADQLVLAMGDSVLPDETQAATRRLRDFFRRHARDAEFLLDSQYHGKDYLSARPARKLTGQS